VIDYTGGSRQLRTEGSSFAGVFLLAVVLIFLVLAAQFNSFRDPFIILLGSVPLAMFGAAIFMFFEDAVRKIPHRRLDDFVQHLLASRSVTLVGLVSKNGFLIVQFANQLQRDGMEKLAAVAQAARIRLRPIMMVKRCHCRRSLSADPGYRRGCCRAKLDRSRVGGWNGDRNIFTLFIVPSLYMLIAKEHHEKSLMDADIEGTDDADVAPELEPALARDGNGNGWKQG